jgi:MFS superfamily sulfate permease-like transporter
MNTILTVIGILLSTMGVVLIYYFGLSPFLKSHESGYVMVYSREEIQDMESKENRRKRIYARLSNIGLLLCVLGGMLQIVAVI